MWDLKRIATVVAKVTIDGACWMNGSSGVEVRGVWGEPGNPVCVSGGYLLEY